MKKKNIFLKLIAITLIVFSVALVAACGNGKTVNAELNSASGTQATTNKAETSKDITLDKAIEIALKDAGVARENAKFKETGLDSDDKTPHYDIEFVAGNKSYDYEIAVSEGKILTSTNKTFESTVPEEKVTKTDINTASTTKAASGYISVDEAKNAALKDAGIAKENASFEKAEFDGNDLLPHYDIEFNADGYEYDYEIKAADGTVLEKDKEREPENKPVSTTATDYISEEKAIEKALDHAGVKLSDAKVVKSNLDSDDIIVHYEIEFVAGNFEYEYEINAKNGNVIAAEKDRRD